MLEIYKTKIDYAYSLLRCVEKHILFFCFEEVTPLGDFYV